MINRKADINAGETVVANSFGTNYRGSAGPGGDQSKNNKDKPKEDQSTH